MFWCSLESFVLHRQFPAVAISVASITADREQHRMAQCVGGSRQSRLPVAGVCDVLSQFHVDVPSLILHNVNRSCLKHCYVLLLLLYTQPGINSLWLVVYFVRYVNCSVSTDINMLKGYRMFYLATFR